MIGLRKLVWLLLCLCPSQAWADAVENEYRTRRSPTMAVFYSVADDGRSTREPVDVATISDPGARPSRAIVTGRPKSKRKVRPKAEPLQTISVSDRHVHRDSFAEFRCEQYGFYYTRNGKCLMPAWSWRNTAYKGMQPNSAKFVKPHKLTLPGQPRSH